MVALTALAALLLATSAMAIPTNSQRHAARIARRAHQSQPKQEVPGHGAPAMVNVNGTIHEDYSSNWAGAVYHWPKGYIQSVTASLIVPTPKIPPGGDESTTYSSAAWVGIDGYTCQSAILQSGIDFTVQGSSVSFDSWYEWYPAASNDFLSESIQFKPGDHVTITVTAVSSVGGIAQISNDSTGQVVAMDLYSPNSPLCQQDVEWIVEDYTEGGLVPFANFGTVEFTNTVGWLNNGQSTFGIGAANAATIDIVNANGQVITSTSVTDTSVTVQYTG